MADQSETREWLIDHVADAVALDRLELVGWYSDTQGIWPHGSHVKPIVADAQGFVPVFRIKEPS